MKIVHFSDTHLGFSDLDIVNDKGINQREADFYKAFCDIVDNILKIKPDFIIHTGDLFHRSSPSNRAINVALSEFKRIERANIPLIIIAGNHSTPKTSTSSPILKIFENLDNFYPIYSQKYEKVEFKEIVFHALPHINDENLIDDQLKKIEKSIDKSRKNILLMHCSVGAYYLMHEFGEWVYPKDKEYLFEKFDYVALGHWHGFGRVGKFKNVYYSGSSERTSSSDKRDDKGYVLVDIKDKLKVEHKIIPLRKSFEFSIDAQKFEDEISKLDLSGIKDALVEVTLKNLTPLKSIDITAKEIEDIFKGTLYVRVKREFIEIDTKNNLHDMESISLESYFLEHIFKNIEDKKEKERLTQKAKELFANCEIYDDTTYS